ncbi:DUF4381 domain-containing protein [Geminicoccus roseus]|uniref:DUF4381 domain-containing protein n=1 Tax=Geminicoccus roseus TaxID=404900 RepID=UPI0003F82098|nr:DUF4381 domain-containing protein [Geminicoccus roseus]
MDQTDPGSLAGLHDIVASPPVPFWPPAPGWYVVALALAMTLGWACWRTARRWRADAYRRAALAELQSAGGRRDQLTILPELLKRTALAAYPRERVASLSGQAWLAFLDETAAAPAFTTGPGRPLGALAYDPGLARRMSEADGDALLAAATAWIRRHRAAP